MSSKVLTVIIPAYQEPYLQKTIDSYLATSELEDALQILAVYDGRRYAMPLKEDPRVKVIQLHKRRGMRGCINAGLSEAKGEFVSKVDAHCVFVDKGFDRKMVESCATNRLVVPKMFEVNESKWERDRQYKGIDYHYPYYPDDSNGKTMGVVRWFKWNSLPMDDTMTFGGSCWLADRKYFMEKVGFLDDRQATYGSFIGEQLEIGLKYWLNGGEVKVNKTIGYGHLSKNREHYVNHVFSKSLKHGNMIRPHLQWVAKHWVNDEEPGMKYPFAWLLEKFWPVPSWPVNWKAR